MTMLTKKQPKSCFLQDIQVYHYYRDLINFKQRGDPMMMLRCINPNEARMLDAASGIHIKFRLAGVSTYTKNMVTEPGWNLPNAVSIRTIQALLWYVIS